MVDSFITFGCWNKGYCDPKIKKNPLSSVMHSLINLKQTPKFYVILGDNYYPDKKGKKGK